MEIKSTVMKDTSKHSGRAGLWPFLAASVALNLAAAAWLLHWQLHHAQVTASTTATERVVAVQGPSLSATVVIPATAPSAAQHPAPAAALEPAVAQQFRWSQLEADDYPTYISRLRGIACPESTIKDIIAGELRVEFAPRRAEIERRVLRSSDWSPPRGISRQEYFAAQIRKLEREIELAVSKLMQSAPGLETQAVAEGQSQNTAPPVRYPAAMEELNFQNITTAAPGQKPRPAEQFKYIAPGVVEASPEQLASLQEIQEKFVQDLGGPNQDVEDPQYEENWRVAQWKADQLLRTRHGWAAHNNLVRASVMKAQTEQKKTASE